VTSPKHIPHELSPQARVRRQQQLNDLCSAAIRALTDRPRLAFRGRRLHDGQRPLTFRAPHLHPDHDTDDFASFRGAADAMALSLLHSDPDLRSRLCPQDDDIAALVFELLEQIRAESLADPVTTGVSLNLQHRHQAWAQAFVASGLTQTTRGMLLYAVDQICRSRVTGEPLSAQTEDFIEASRFGLVPLIGNDLASLRFARCDQAAYAVHAVSIARQVSRQLGQREEEHDLEEDEDRREVRSFNLLVGFEPDEGKEVPIAAGGQSRVLAESGAYHVFTTEYDEVRAAAPLVRAATLRGYCEQLDRGVRELGIDVPRLARHLAMLLDHPRYEGWEGAQEEGQVDGRRLARLVSSPTDHRVFQTNRLLSRADASVTFLLDCSGSMKEYREQLAPLVDVFTRALESADVGVEVLGFTTGAWGGGRARRDWQHAGRPRHPGRLNETRHLVFKDLQTSWRRGRAGLAALLNADIYREGVDGEAVLWAADRLLASDPRRHLLLVVSDGSPMDSATNLANDRGYLDHHLQQVVGRLETSGAIEVYGVGVGLDLSPYYSRSCVLDLAGPARQIVADLLTLLAATSRALTGQPRGVIDPPDSQPTLQQGGCPGSRGS